MTKWRGNHSSKHQQPPKTNATKRPYRKSTATISRFEFICITLLALLFPWRTYVENEDYQERTRQNLSSTNDDRKRPTERRQLQRADDVYKDHAKNDRSDVATKSKMPHSEDSNMANNVTVILQGSTIPRRKALREAVHSLHHLKGLSPDIPIIVVIQKISNDGQLRKLMSEFRNDNIRFLPRKSRRTTVIAISDAMELVTTEYVYLLDLRYAFQREVDHTTLVKSMGENPDLLQSIRFRLRNQKHLDEKTCSEGPFNVSSAFTLNGLSFRQSRYFLDSHQFARKEHFDRILAVTYASLRMSSLMIDVARKNCAVWGQAVYDADHEAEPYVYKIGSRRIDDVTNVTAINATNATSLTKELNGTMEMEHLNATNEASILLDAVQT